MKLMLSFTLDIKRIRKHKPETIEKMKGRIRSKEQNEKISKALKGKAKTDEHKSKLRGEKTDEHKLKLSEAWKNRKFSERELLNRAAARVGNKWWNDGIKNKFCKTSPGSDWMEGMVFKARRKNINHL